MNEFQVYHKKYFDTNISAYLSILTCHLLPFYILKKVFSAGINTEYALQNWPGDVMVSQAQSSSSNFPGAMNMSEVGLQSFVFLT